MILHFPTSPNYWFCTTCEKKPKIASLHVNAECCFANRHTRYIHIITWSQLNRPSFTQVSTVCTKQNLRREYSMLPSVIIIYRVCHDDGHCVKSGSCSLSSLKWKVNGQYWWDILLSQRMLAVIKNVVDYSIICLSATQLMHAHSNTVQQQLRKTTNFISPELWPKSQSQTQLIRRFRKSIAM